MATPLPYKVYKRAKGDPLKQMIAGFSRLDDAVTWAIDTSKFRYAYHDTTLTVHGIDGRVKYRFRAGVRL